MSAVASQHDLTTGGRLDDARPRLSESLAAFATLGPLFLGVYGLTNWRASTLDAVPTASFSWESAVPFVPWMIVPYMSLDVLWAGAFFLAPSRRVLRLLSQRLAFAILVSGLFFLLLPLRVEFERPATSGIPGALFALLRFDQPFNMCPSLHVSQLFIVLRAYNARGGRLARALFAGWFALIGASTMLVWQHHAIDLAGGIVVAAAALALMPESGATRAQTNPGVGLLYLGAGFALTTGALLGQPWTLPLAWPAVSLLVVAIGYLAAGGRILDKRPGGRGLVAQIVLAPYLVGSWLSSRVWRRRLPPWTQLASGLRFGRRLGARETRRLIDDGYRVVVDLAGELPRRKEYEHLHVLDVPLLDMTLPTSEALARIVEFIERGRSAGVFVHCALGCGRAPLVAAAWLLSQRPDMAIDAAMRRARELRPRTRFAPGAASTLATFRDRLGEGASPLHGQHPATSIGGAL